MVETRSPRPTFAMLIGIGAAALLLLPAVTTFDEFLTGAAMSAGLDSHIAWLVPAESRMVVALLNLFGTGAVAHGAYISLPGTPQGLFISWNCIGWQSLLLLGMTMLTGLRGGHRREALVQAVLLGLLGTFLVNLLRVTMVCLLAARVGYGPAVLFHDYGGTLLLVAWLFVFWSSAYRWVFVPARLAGSS